MIAGSFKVKPIIRPFGRAAKRGLGFLAALPLRLRPPQVAPPRHVAHSSWVDYLSSTFNAPGRRVLELGSRNVTGANHRHRFARAEYIGFDFYPGENVDVVGDAHHLSSYFQGQERFDLIFSSAVFEHLYMPWVAAIEIQKMLKLGGHVFIETHFSFSSHERPWNFFQFSDMGLRALFNRSLGFDLVDSGMSNPISGYFASGADLYLRYLPVIELYCHSEILCRKRCEVEDFGWDKLTMDEVVEGARYPAPPEQECAQRARSAGQAHGAQHHERACDLDDQERQRRAHGLELAGEQRQQDEAQEPGKEVDAHQHSGLPEMNQRGGGERCEHQDERQGSQDPQHRDGAFVPVAAEQTDDEGRAKK